MPRHILTIEGRAIKGDQWIAVMPGLQEWAFENVRACLEIELRRPDGTRRITYVEDVGYFVSPWSKIILLPEAIRMEDVPKGTKIWTTRDEIST
jgi:hypothetical protein